MPQSSAALPVAAFHDLVRQHLTLRSTDAAPEDRSRPLCGLWIAWQRSRLRLTREALAALIGIPIETLTLLELGRATPELASDEQWEEMSLQLTDLIYDSDRVMRIVTLALGHPVLGKAIVLNQVAHDLGALVADDADVEESHALSEPELNQIVELLCQNMFAGLDELYLRLLAQQVESETFAAGQVIFRQNSAGDALYIIASGLAQVVIETRDGNELVIDQPGPGKCVGEFALLDGRPRAATVRAIEATRMLRLSRQLFERVCAEHPAIYRSIAAELARKLRTTNTYVEFFHDYSPSERLLMGMRYLAPLNKQQTGDVISYDLAAIREALTRVPGNTPESVDNDLASLKEAGVLTLTQKQAKLHVPTLVRKLA